ncbi:M28 family peptidase [Halorubrum vacuolatum]|uniref:Carboxypeptidase Q n=1 Tax=Halorubrum vacuolatum TaxID=63740 RepID=A0A238XZM7_HALVU|nr:M28 family metallopeptidase [Halorubrum vacuolatum]SNR64152.1 Zn-dependent amino- or carboxypeptidase, M28 family [Halorubrum vacuolatum]
MTTLSPTAIGKAYLDTHAWELLTALSDLDDRMPGHEGEAVGSKLVAEGLAEAGLRNVTRTSFPIPGWWRDGTSVTVRRKRRDAVFEDTHELVELPGTPSGTITGEIVDMGYGLPEDFEGVNLTGTIAMASSLTPDDYGRWVHRSEKYSYAAESGAEAFLFYNHIPGALPPTGSIGRRTGPGPIPAVGLSKEVGSRLVRRCEDAPPDGGTEATVTVDARNEPATSANVEAVVGPDTDEEVLFTAHVDAHDVGNGANDNGFGSALAVGVARILAAIEDDLETRVRIAVFGAEETGLYGSYYWTHTHDLDRVKCVLNADGVGYSRDLEIHTHGFEAIGEAFAEVSDEHGVPIATDDGLRPHSDHWPFVQRGVAAAQARSTSDDSGRGWGHTHGDTLDKLDPRDLRDLSVLCAAGIAKLAESDRPIDERSSDEIRDEAVETKHDVGMKATDTWPWGEPRDWPWDR